jgi:hypothetical protein
MYVGCNLGGTILVIKNKQINNTFKGCNGINSVIFTIIFDQSGFMAASCKNGKLYLYNNNLQLIQKVV